MRPHNLRLDLSPASLVPADFSAVHLHQPTEATMSTENSQRAKLPLSRSYTDPTKRLAFVNVETIPANDTFSSYNSRHRSSTDSSSDSESCSLPKYDHAIDKPTSTYAATLARRSRANTTDNTPSHSPMRLSRTTCPSCGALKRSVAPPPSTSAPAERACSPPRSKHFRNMQTNLGAVTICESCMAATQTRLLSRHDDEDVFVPLFAYLTDEDDGRQPRRRRRRGSSGGGNVAGDT